MTYAYFNYYSAQMFLVGTNTKMRKLVIKNYNLSIQEFNNPLVKLTSIEQLFNRKLWAKARLDIENYNIVSDFITFKVPLIIEELTMFTQEIITNKMNF